MRISDWSSDVCSSDLAGRSASVPTLPFAPVSIALMLSKSAKKFAPEPKRARLASWKFFAAVSSSFSSALPALKSAKVEENFDEALLYTVPLRSEEHTSELQSLMRISYAVFCLKTKKQKKI